jgi:hypothetical protein
MLCIYDPFKQIPITTSDQVHIQRRLNKTEVANKNKLKCISRKYLLLPSESFKLTMFFIWRAGRV